MGRDPSAVLKPFRDQMGWPILATSTNCEKINPHNQHR